MPEKLQSLVIDLKVRFWLLLLFLEVPFLRNRRLFILAGLSIFSLVIVILFASDDVIWVVLPLHGEEIDFLIASVTIDPRLQTIGIAQILLDFLGQLELERLVDWSLLL
jgi:hypothetical protein